MTEKEKKVAEKYKIAVKESTCKGNSYDEIKKVVECEDVSMTAKRQFSKRIGPDTDQAKLDRFCETYLKNILKGVDIVTAIHTELCEIERHLESLSSQLAQCGEASIHDIGTMVCGYGDASEEKNRIYQLIDPVEARKKELAEACKELGLVRHARTGELVPYGYAHR